MTDPNKINKRKELLLKYVVTFMNSTKESKDKAQSIINKEF